jgi:hypothetical protein
MFPALAGNYVGSFRTKCVHSLTRSLAPKSPRAVQFNAIGAELNCARSLLQLCADKPGLLRAYSVGLLELSTTTPGTERRNSGWSYVVL